MNAINENVTSFHAFNDPSSKRKNIVNLYFKRI